MMEEFIFGFCPLTELVIHESSLGSPCPSSGHRDSLLAKEKVLVTSWPQGSTLGGWRSHQGALHFMAAAPAADSVPEEKFIDPVGPRLQETFALSGLHCHGQQPPFGRCALRNGCP